MSKIISCEEIGEYDTYDLEVDHPDHQYYLANGVLTSNSHAYAYSVISVQTAYLKCHYPAEFMCALLNSEDPSSDKATEYSAECDRMNISIQPPDINKSDSRYTVIDDKNIVMGLSAIKGIGDAALSEISNKKPFHGFIHFLDSTDTKAVGKTAIQALCMAGALDSFGLTRKYMHDNCEDIRATLKKMKKKKVCSDEILVPEYHEEWERRELLLNERNVLGRTVSGSLHEVFKSFFRNSSAVTQLNKLSIMSAGTKVKIEVIVNSLKKEFKIKNGKNIGKKFAKYLVEDVNGDRAELTLWADQYEKYMHSLKDGTPIKAIVKVDEYMEQKGLVLLDMEAIFGVR